MPGEAPLLVRNYKMGGGEGCLAVFVSETIHFMIPKDQFSRCKYSLMEYQLFADLLRALCKISEHFLNDINVSDHLLYRIALTLMAPGFFYPDNYFTFL